MAGNSTVAAMTAASALDGSELLYSVQSGNDRKATTLQVKTLSVGAGSVSVASGKTLTANVSMTLGGGDASALSIAAGKTLTASVTMTLQGGDASVLSIAAAKTATFSNSITFAGTDSTTMTFPSTTATIARTDAGQTFTGINTFSGGTLTTSQPFTFTQTWNAGAVSFDALVVNATSTSSAATSFLAKLQLGGSNVFTVRKDGAIFPNNDTIQIGGSGNVGINLANDLYTIKFGGSADVIIGRGGAAATLQHGATDAASPVAQTITVQSVSTGTSNGAGSNWTLSGSKSTGAGVPGDIIFRTAGKGAASTTQNTLITALTIKGGTTDNTNVGYPSVVIGNAALATNASDGFLYIPTCAGTPTGTPTAFSGRVALVYDTTNHQFWIYDGSWLQPKTPAAAAVVNWQ